MCTKANYGPCKGDTRSVGGLIEGKSVYDVYDLAGNVAEWTSSLLWDYPYDPNDGRESISSFEDRVRRGGSFDNQYFEIDVFLRRANDPNTSSDWLGFRCAWDPYQ
jgi:formylglycine-generating enzyme required for sulfatase activity